MQLGGQGLMPDITAPRISGMPQMEGGPVDLEKLLTLSLIRTHTKTDDVPHVTDEQLRLYRAAAFEAAEKYTGRIFSELRVIQEPLSRKAHKRWRHSYTHRLRHPSADGIVYIYGAPYGQGDRQVNIGPGGREIQMPVLHGAFDDRSCCGGSGGGNQLNYGMMAMYRAGVSCAESVPSGIIVGCLKFIAWMVANPGDEIMTVRNRASQGEMGIIGTNNGAWASGAIEQWRIHVDGAI